MGLAGAAVPEQQHVLSSQQELRADQFQHHGLVQRRDGEEVEAVEALDHWELRLAHAALGSPALAVQQLQFAHAQQITRIYAGILPHQFGIPTSNFRLADDAGTIARYWRVSQD